MTDTQNDPFAPTRDEQIAAVRAAWFDQVPLWSLGVDQIERLAALAVDARNQPMWPTDLTLGLIFGTPLGDSPQRELRRGAAKSGMLADPILQAAISLRKYWEGGGHNDAIYAEQPIVAVVEAVKAAGL